MGRGKGGEGRERGMGREVEGKGAPHFFLTTLTTEVNSYNSLKRFAEYFPGCWRVTATTELRRGPQI